MNTVKIRSYVVAGLLLATAVWTQISPRPGKVAGHTEAWMEQVAPARVGNYTFIVDPDPRDADPGCSYKTSKYVYDTLVPTIGILARIYQSGERKFDVTLIASRDRSSFHDPRVCFTSQGYKLTDGPLVTIPTKTRGDIPATVADLQSADGAPSIAVYFYRGPKGFYGSTASLKVSLLWDQVMGRTDLDAVFYRFIFPAQSTPENKELLISFVSTYMDEAGKQSGGYF